MSLREVRAIVGPDTTLTDAELLALVESLRPLARLIVETARTTPRTPDQPPTS